MTLIIKNKKYIVFILLAILIVYLILRSFTGKTDRQDGGFVINEDGDERVYEEEEEIEDKRDDTYQAPNTIYNEDIQFAKEWETIYREYPWYRNIPVEKEGYRIIWILKEKTFKIRLKIPENSPEEQKNRLLEKALTEIEELTGESSSKYPYYVVYTE